MRRTCRIVVASDQLSCSASLPVCLSTAHFMNSPSTGAGSVNNSVIDAVSDRHRPFVRKYPEINGFGEIRKRQEPYLRRAYHNMIEWRILAAFVRREYLLEFRPHHNRRGFN